MQHQMQNFFEKHGCGCGWAIPEGPWALVDSDDFRMKDYLPSRRSKLQGKGYVCTCCDKFILEGSKGDTRKGDRETSLEIP